MASVHKIYRSAFVVEKTKLVKLTSVINERLGVIGSSRLMFDATLSGLKAVSYSSLDDVLALDNSHRSRVERLIIKSGSERGDQDADDGILIDFDSRRPADVMIQVRAGDTKWATASAADLEEQVERFLDRNPLYKILNLPSELLVMLGLSLGVLLIALVFVLVLASKSPEAPSTNMWLSPSDFRELAPILQKDRLSQDDLLEVTRRQLRNLNQRVFAPIGTGLADWQLVAALVPLVIIFGSLLVLVRCYPTAVFLWGDAEDWYARLQRRRRTIWVAVILALILEVIANLAVFGVSDLMGRASVS